MASTCGIERDNYLLVSEVTRWMGDNGWHGNSRIWFPPQDELARSNGCSTVNLHDTYLAIEQAGMLWKLTTPLPVAIDDLSPRDVRNLGEKPRSNLVILSQPPSAERLDRELDTWSKTKGVSPLPRRIRSRTFTHGSLSITVQVYQLQRGRETQVSAEQASSSGTSPKLARGWRHSQTVPWVLPPGPTRSGETP
jgi:hypothetical protein